MILSTKNRYLRIIILPMIIAIALLIYYIFYFNSIETYVFEDYLYPFTLIFTLYGLYCSNLIGTYINIYEDYIEGNFLYKFTSQNRYIKREQIKEATMVGLTRVRIHTENETYTIVTNPKLANKVYDYINKEYIKK